MFGHCHARERISAMSTSMSKHAITRVRHEPRRRLLTVRQVERITPTMARMTLDGDLAGFVSASYDDHVKVFFPLPGDTRADPAGSRAGRRHQRRGAFAGTRLHAAPLRHRAERADHRLRAARRGTGDRLGLAGRAGPSARGRRAARLVRRARRLRLVSVHRRRDRAAGDRPAARGASLPAPAPSWSPR